MAQSYKDLLVWQKAMNLLVEVYRVTKMLPKCETYGLSDQMRRAAVSIPSNIAEGYSRHSPAEFKHFLYIARGSQAELETQLQACIFLEYLSEAETAVVISLCTETGRMLSGLINKLETSN